MGGALGAAITAQLLQARWQRTNTPGPLQPKEQTPDIDKDPVPETVQPSDTVQTAAAGTVRGTPGSGQDPLLEIIIDEGGLILRDGMPPLAHGPLAIVGTAEKVRLRQIARDGTYPALMCGRVYTSTNAYV